jgi:large subunit ribosomal protein L20
MQHGRRRSFRLAKQAVRRALEYAYRDRRTRKRDMRRLWITRISAALQQSGLSYSRFIAGLDRSDIALDRKILSELAVKEPAAFAKVVETAQEK